MIDDDDVPRLGASLLRISVPHPHPSSARRNPHSYCSAWLVSLALFVQKMKDSGVVYHSRRASHVSLSPLSPFSLAE